MMEHFALRTTVQQGPLAKVRQQIPRPQAPAQLAAAYFASEHGQLFSVFAGAPIAGGSLVVPITPEEYGPPGIEPAAGDGNDLQLVLVRRKLGPIQEREFRALALQAIMCAHEYSDLLWMRSFWAVEQEELTCVFRTRHHDLVREHAQRSRIPCDEVSDAVEVHAWHT
jgi:hypothetical protein